MSKHPFMPRGYRLTAELNKSREPIGNRKNYTPPKGPRKLPGYVSKAKVTLPKVNLP